MRPTRTDVHSLAVALFTVFSSLQRARQKGDAATLALLNIVAAHPKVRPSDIASALGVNQSSITRQMQKFEQRGFVRLAADPHDGRSCHILLTPAGRTEMRRLQSIGLDRFALFVKDWDARDVQKLTHLLARFEMSKAAAGPHESRGPSWRTNANSKAKAEASARA
jgi:DNA-binding MarR family transcriptional regulator